MKLSLILILTMVLCACKVTNNMATEDNVLQITHGTSFGRCNGYCTKTLTYSKEKSFETEQSRNEKNFPLKTTQIPWSKQEWNMLTQALSSLDISSIPDTIGCPDCADGGAEFIEITTKTGIKKITFEFGVEVKELTPFLHTLRKLKAEKIKEE